MEKQCEKCKYYIKTICGGISGVCEDYKKVPEITEEEKKYWEKECDASKYRRISYYYSSGSGYFIENVNV